ncbi:MAG: esterase family protein, partial [Sphingobacteriales bacterium]
MKRLNFLFTLVALLFVQGAFAAKVDTVVTYSAAMKKNIKAVVVLPDGYDDEKSYPSVYLLHGAGDKYSGWID